MVRAAIGWYDNRAPRLGQLTLTKFGRVVGHLLHLLIHLANDDAVTLLALAHVGRDPRGIERRLAERDPP